MLNIGVVSPMMRLYGEVKREGACSRNEEGKRSKEEKCVKEPSLDEGMGEATVHDNEFEREEHSEECGNLRIEA